MSAPMEFPERFNMAWYFLDRNVEEGRGDKRCLYWRDEAYTYREVQAQSNRFGNALRVLGVGRRGPRAARPARPAGVRLRLVRRGQGRGRDRHGEPARCPPRTSPTTSSTPGQGGGGGRVDPRPHRAAARLASATCGTWSWSAIPRGHVSFAEACEKAWDRLENADTHRDDPAIWLFTSGSTGKPKAAVHLQQDLPWNTERYAKQVMGIREDDLTVSVPKLFFGYATGTNLLFPFAVGAATALFSERSEPGDAVRRHRALPADDPHVRAHHDQRDAEPSRAATDARPVVAAPDALRGRGAAPRAVPALEGDLRGRDPGRHRLGGDVPHLHLQLPRRRGAGQPGPAGARATRRASWTRTGADVARGRGGHALGQGRVGGHPLLAGPREVEGGPARRLGGHRRPHAAGRARATSGTRAGPTTCSRSAASS